MIDAPMSDSDGLTHDRWYDGSLYLWQPKRGFRASTDAVLLAAAVPSATKTAIELGAGGGAVALALACRLPEIAITAVENDPLMVQLLDRNITDNAYNARITPLKADIFAKNWCEKKSYELAFFNPPYNDSASSLSPEISRRAAMAGASFTPWVAAAANSTTSRGQLLAIIRADRLDEMLAALSQINAGAVAIKPIHSYADRPAIRVLVMAKKASSATPLTLLPPLILRTSDRLTDEMERISHQHGTIDMRASKSDKGQNLGLKK